MLTAESGQLAARRLMVDSHNALYMLQAAVDDPTENWRVYWVAAVAILRAMGQVLKDIDSANDPEIAGLIAEAWPKWQHDPVFQRLDTPHEKNQNGYDFGVDSHVSLAWLGPCALPEESEGEGNGHSDSENGANGQHPHGFLCFAGNSQDAVEALWEIWHWWADRIAALEQLTGQIDMTEGREQAYERFVGSPAC